MADWTAGAYATAYQIQVSAGDDQWTTVKNVTVTEPGLNLVEFDPVEAQKVRILADAYNAQWGMSLTEFGVYGEEITGEAGVTAAAREAGTGVYHVTAGLEHIYQKYGNMSVRFTYDPSVLTLLEEPAGFNEKALLKTVDAVSSDNEDGTKTVSFSYGIKDQNAFKEPAEVMTGVFAVAEGAQRSEVGIQIALTNAAGHITELPMKTVYVPNIFTYEELTGLIEQSEDLLYGALQQACTRRRHGMSLKQLLMRRRK